MEQKSPISKLFHGLKCFSFSLALDTENSEFFDLRGSGDVLVDEFKLRITSLHQFYLSVDGLIDVINGVELPLTQQGT
jgi:hypothetical protein